MTACQHCKEAEQRGMAYGGYNTSRCAQCAARGVARSQAAFLAFARRDETELHAQVRRVFRRTPPETAWAMVRRWWDLDHRGST